MMGETLAERVELTTDNMIKKHKHKFILYDDERHVFKNPKIKRDPFIMCADCDYVNMSPTEKQLLDLRNK